MNYRRLGRAGLKLSELSLGSWATFADRLDKHGAKALLKLAYERGVNFFDNAEGYAEGQSEVLMGEAIQELGWPRGSYCVSSKVYWGDKAHAPLTIGLNRKHVYEACHGALQRLRVDHLDLYFCHRPDPDTPIEEVVEAMSLLVRQGKVMYWGTSEWSVQEIMEAYGIARQYHLVPPQMEQPQYNLFQRHKVEVEYARAYEAIGLGTTTFSPLASGALTGKYNDGIPADSRVAKAGWAWLEQLFSGPDFERKIAQVRQLMEVAAELDLSVTRLAIAWCLKFHGVSTVILGATKPEQLEENLAAVDDAARLTPEVLERIDAIVGKPAA